MSAHYFYELGRGIFLYVLVTAVLVFILISIKKWDIPKWYLLLWLVLFVICVFVAIELKSMKDDLQNASYVTYHGEYHQICRGMETRQSTTIYVDGKEKHLTSTAEMTKNGHFYGYVVYSERSGYVVYVGENPPDQNK